MKPNQRAQLIREERQRLGLCKYCGVEPREKNAYCASCWQKVLFSLKTTRLAYNLFSHARQRARTKGQEFTITKEYVQSLIDKTKCCPILGIALNYSGQRKNWDNDSPTLDRILPHLGYTQENTWLISWRANALKKDATLKELQLLAFAVSNELLRRNLKCV